MTRTTPFMMEDNCQECGEKIDGYIDGNPICQDCIDEANDRLCTGGDIADNECTGD